MLKFGLIISSLIYLVAAAGELVILRAPKSLEFSGKERIKAEDIPDVLAASLGFTPRKGINWPGLTIKDPFGFADRLIVVAVDGVSTLGEFSEVPVFPIHLNKDERTLWNLLDEDLREHYPTDYDKRDIFRRDFAKVDTELTPEFLKTRNLDDVIEEDLFFFQDLVALQDYEKSLPKDGVNSLPPAVNWLAFSGLQGVQTARGADESTTVSFKKDMREEILKLAKTLDDISDEKAMLVVIIGDGSYSRLARAAGDPAVNNTIPGNQATVFTTNYPAIFNIMLWFGVTLVLSLIAISYFIATMDPGRDSIIYRMTSNRMKKDS